MYIHSLFLAVKKEKRWPEEEDVRESTKRRVRALDDGERENTTSQVLRNGRALEEKGGGLELRSPSLLLLVPCGLLPPVVRLVHAQDFLVSSGLFGFVQQRTSR